MGITPSELVLGLVCAALAIGLLYSTVQHVRTNRTNAQGQIDLMGAFTDALKDFSSSEFLLTIGKAAAHNIPPEVFVDMIARIKSGEVVVGEDTKAGQLLKALEQLVEQVDADPTNDPAKIMAGLKTIIAVNKPTLLPNG